MGGDDPVGGESRRENANRSTTQQQASIRSPVFVGCTGGGALIDRPFLSEYQPEARPDQANSSQSAKRRMPPVMNNDPGDQGRYQSRSEGRTAGDDTRGKRTAL